MIVYYCWYPILANIQLVNFKSFKICLIIINIKTKQNIMKIVIRLFQCSTFISIAYFVCSLPYLNFYQPVLKLGMQADQEFFVLSKSIIVKQIMIKLIVCTLILLSKQSFTSPISSKVTAQLYLVAHEPVVSFRLTFSQPVQLPQFQILINNNNLGYTITTQSNFTDSYNFKLLQQIHIFNTYVQSYSLIFNYPLNIANGRLSVASFILEPIRAPIILQTQNWPAYLLLICVYLVSLFGIIGLWLIQSIQIFILTEYTFQHTTTVYKFIGDAFFMNIRKEVAFDSNYLLELATPLLIVFAVFLVCLAIKHALKNFFLLYIIHIRYFFAYNLLLTVWSIFSVPILYKAYQYVDLANSNRIFLADNQKRVCIIITYFNFISTFIYLYLMWFTLNSKPCEDAQIFEKFIHSQNFEEFYKLNKAIDMSTWQRRNFAVFTAIRKFSIVFIFFFLDTFTDKVFFSQVILLFYVFITRPFKQDFYTQSSIIIDLCIFFFFLIIMEANVYFNMSDFLMPQTAINAYLIVKNVLFIIMSSTILVFAVIENFKIFNHIQYQIKLFSQFKQNSVVQGQTQSVARKRLYTESSNGSIRKRSTNNYKIPQLQSLTGSFIVNRFSPQKNFVNKNTNTSSKRKLNLFQVQMQQMLPSSLPKKRTSLNKQMSLTSQKSLKKLNSVSSLKSQKSQKKQKQKNLFQQLADKSQMAQSIKLSD